MTDSKNLPTTGPSAMMLDALMHGADGVVERAEERGQDAFVHSDVLPVDCGPNRKDYEALGFVFGQVIKNDPIFQEATLPDGWTKAKSDHSMWSYLADPDGYERVAVFYKDAFYDRSAFMRLEDVPLTRAQKDAKKEGEIAGVSALQQKNEGEPFWSSATPRREGPNAVIAFMGHVGKKAAEASQYSGVTEWTKDARQLEFTVAPDGTVLGRREFLKTETN